MKATMYVAENNAGRAILFNFLNEWYYSDCSPWDNWGDVELHKIIKGEEDGIEYEECITLEALAEKLRLQNEQYIGYCSTDFSDEQIGVLVPEYSGMSAEEIKEKEYCEIALVGDVEVE